MQKYNEPWIEKDKRRKTYRIRWWKRVNGEWVKDKGISCGRDHTYAKDTEDKIRERLKKESLGEVDLSRKAADCFEAYILDLTINETPANSIQSMRDSVTPFIQKVDATGDITLQVLRDHKTAMLTSTNDKAALATNTVRRRLSDIRTWLYWATTNEWFKECPWQKEKLKDFIPEFKSRARFYTDEEVAAIDQAIQSTFWVNNLEKAATEEMDSAEFFAIWQTICETGMREGEVIRLQKEKIQPLADGEGLATVVSIKGGKVITRVVLVPRKVMELLPKVDGGYYFPRWINWVTEKSGELRAMPLYPKLQWHWKKALRKAKIVRGSGEARATLYCGRHTFARRYLEEGGDMGDLAVVLGHTSLDMIQKVYGHIRAAVVQARMRATQKSAGQWRGKINVSLVKFGQEAISQDKTDATKPANGDEAIPSAL